MSTRTQRLRERTLESVHKQARIVMPDWDVSDLPLSLPERKASAIAIILERMPLYIGEEELIVGTRTVYGYPGEDSDDKSFFDYNALPHYVNEKDREYFELDQEAVSQAHYAPDFGILLKKGIGGIIREAQERLDFLNANISADAEVATLGVAQQQLVEIAKALSQNARILIMDEPTRGIDIGAKTEIYKLITQMAQQNRSVIMVSSELPEIIGMSDRVLVLCAGRLTGELTGEKINQQDIMRCATNQAALVG